MWRLLVPVCALVVAVGGCGVQADPRSGGEHGPAAETSPARPDGRTGPRGAARPGAEETSAMDGRCGSEIHELHQFFEDWFTARLDATEESFRRFADVLADGFEIVSPEGRKLDRDEILSAVRGTHGMHAAVPFRIWVDDVVTRDLGGGLLLATYEEWQSVGQRTRGRLSTAIFRPREGAPHGLEWVHVHEVWLADR